MSKRYAEIDGKSWQAVYPFCAGCPELAISGECLYEGNGCRYPEERIKMPRNLYLAFRALALKSGEGMEEVARELGDCEIDKETSDED